MFRYERRTVYLNISKLNQCIFPYWTLYEFAGINFCLQSWIWQKSRQIDENFVNLPCINKIYGPRERKWISGVLLMHANFNLTKNSQPCVNGFYTSLGECKWILGVPFTHGWWTSAMCKWNLGVPFTHGLWNQFHEFFSYIVPLENIIDERSALS